MSGTDLISRADAIEAVEHITSSMSVCVNTDECHGMKRMQRQAVIELANIPSAQKTQLSTEDTTFDCISRQAAIDAADMADYPGLSIEDVDKVTGEVVKALKELPSAQPYTEEQIQTMQDLESAEIEKAYELGRESAQQEIIRCKECKHFHYDMPYVIQGVPVLGHEVCDFWGDGCKTSENGFCSYAERENSHDSPYGNNGHVPCP